MNYKDLHTYIKRYKVISIVTHLKLELDKGNLLKSDMKKNNSVNNVMTRGIITAKRSIVDVTMTFHNQQKFSKLDGC